MSASTVPPNPSLERTTGLRPVVRSAHDPLADEASFVTSQALRFSSKIDRPLLIAGMLPLGAGTIGCAILGAKFHEPIGWVVSFLLLIAVCFVAWIYLATYYEVNGSQLYIRSGPFTWQIATDEIHSVLPSGSMLSSPALSLDRLEIQYGRRRSILVSPAQRSAFLEALTNASPGLAMHATGLRRLV
jgi:hypothetical protein